MKTAQQTLWDMVRDVLWINLTAVSVYIKKLRKSTNKWCNAATQKFGKTRTSKSNFSRQQEVMNPKQT